MFDCRGVNSALSIWLPPMKSLILSASVIAKHCGDETATSNALDLAIDQLDPNYVHC